LTAFPTIEENTLQRYDLKPDDEALISIFYYLGYTHGMRYSLA
jgi:hypothetical protein